MKPLMPSIGTADSLFHDGNPATGDLGTIVSAEWLNNVQGCLQDLQREIIAALAAAQLAPDAATAGQLLTALQALFLGKTAQATDAAKLGGQSPDFYAKASELNAGVKVYAAGTALPTQNLGPIWHADYNSLMTWQVFSNNGATYTGYASVLVGSLLADTQPIPRAGYISSGSMSLSRTAYAALRGWAMHNGVMVAGGVWAAGAIAVADNADGTTFRTYDVRGEFPRFWDAGRGVDIGRTFGSHQLDEFRSHTHSVKTYQGNYGSEVANTGSTTMGPANIQGAALATGGSETRPRNTALLPTIKF